MPITFPFAGYETQHILSLHARSNYLELGLVGIDVVGEDEGLILVLAVEGADHADGHRGAHQSNG